MHAYLFLAIALILTAQASIAAGPARELDEATVVELVNAQTRGGTSRIAVAIILEGSATTKPFEARHVRQVITIHPVPEDGKRVRRMRAYHFHWSETYGWFLWEMRQERGGDAVWIWSELQGEVVIR